MLIPGTRFNKNRNKLFFFTGFEYFYQVLDTGLLRATVPTASELGGQFLDPVVDGREGANNSYSGGPGQQVARKRNRGSATYTRCLIRPLSKFPNGNLGSILIQTWWR